MQFSVAECGEIPEPPSIPHREHEVRGLLKHTGPPPQQLYDHVVEKLRQRISVGKKFKCHLPAWVITCNLLKRQAFGNGPIYRDIGGEMVWIFDCTCILKVCHDWRCQNMGRIT